MKIQEVLNEFQSLFSDVSGLTHITSYCIDEGDISPVKLKYHRCDKQNTEIIDWHVKQLLN